MQFKIKTKLSINKHSPHVNGIHVQIGMVPKYAFFWTTNIFRIGIIRNLSCHVTKPTKWHVRPAKTQISLGIRPVWSVFTVCMKKPWFLATHWAHSEDSDQTGQIPRLIWVFAGRRVILLVLSRGGSPFLENSVYIQCLHGTYFKWVREFCLLQLTDPALDPVVLKVKH